MSSFEKGKQPFLCTGYVVRKYVGAAGTFASLTVDVPGERGGSKLEFRCFASGPIADVGKLEGGQVVRVTSSVDMECLRGKDKQDVIIDGFKKWVPCLTIRAIEVEPSSAAAAGPEDKIGW